MTRIAARPRQVFRAFRRTRPFWGGLWVMLAGLEIIRTMSFTFMLVVRGGWSTSSGYIIGGSLVLLGLTAWLAPLYRSFTGVVAFLLSLLAFIAANLGGYLVGSLLGIVGSSMIWAWGERTPRKRGTRNAAQ